MTSSTPNSPLPPSDLAAYVQQTTSLLGLVILPEQQASVVSNFEHVWQIAQPVLAFDIPDDLEAAPTFKP